MKKTIFLTALIFALAQLAHAQTMSYKKLLGQWATTEEKDQNGSLEFLDSARAAMSIMGTPPRTLMYSIDFSKNPATMDLYRDPSKREMALKCLIQLVDANTLEMAGVPRWYQTRQVR